MLSELFHSQIAAVILTRLFQPDAPHYHLRELARNGGCSAPGLLKELNHFHEWKLLRRQTNKGRTMYYADTECPLFPALCELVAKAEGLHGEIRRMMTSLDTQLVFIFGLEARGTARPDSDIDLFVIGDCSLEEICKALLPAAEVTNREVNPFLLSAKDFRRRYQEDEHFVREIVKSPKIYLKGGANELAKLVGQRVAKRTSHRCGGASCLVGHRGA